MRSSESKAESSHTESLQEIVSQGSSSGSEDEWEDVHDDFNIVVTVKKGPKVENRGDKRACEARQEIVRQLNQRQTNSHKVVGLFFFLSILFLRVTSRSLLYCFRCICFVILPT